MSRPLFALALLVATASPTTFADPFAAEFCAPPHEPGILTSVTATRLGFPSFVVAEIRVAAVLGITPCEVIAAAVTSDPTGRSER